MGMDLVGDSPAALARFETASKLMGIDLLAICRDGSAAELERTDIQQPAIFVTSVLYFEAYSQRPGIDASADFQFAGGLSLGEYTALYAAGAFEFEDGVRLVQQRGRFMQEAAEQTESGMLSLIGADEALAEEICQKARGQEVLTLANLNCPGQVVISGNKAALERAKPLAEDRGLRLVALSVAGAFHSPLMAPAADALSRALEATTIRPPRFPVVRNADAAFYRTPEQIREGLTRQLTAPVLWQKCVASLQKAGVGAFVEFGPGRVLTGLMRKIDRKIPCVNISDLASLRTAAGTGTS